MDYQQYSRNAHTSYTACSGRRPLRRSRDRLLWGVCSGLADWLGMSTGIVRLVFLILLAATGFFPLGAVYILAALFIPAEQE